MVETKFGLWEQLVREVHGEISRDGEKSGDEVILKCPDCTLSFKGTVLSWWAVLDLDTVSYSILFESC